MKLIDVSLTASVAADAKAEKKAHAQKSPERDWRHVLLASLRTSGPSDELEQAARSYSEFRVQEDTDDRQAIDSWYRLSRSNVHAELFHDLHRSDPATADRLARTLTTLPHPGEHFLGFQLVGELGRGAFGRVYLAEQGDLAGRYVVLKIATDIVGESQTLAQLQHTNIVPIYSIHHSGSLQAVCMPYFGATTLADVLEELGNEASLPASGKLLVSTVNARKESTIVASKSVTSIQLPTGAIGDEPPDTTASPLVVSQSDDALLRLKMLEGLSYVEAILWIGSRLADGLAHAHERGIVHRDLKPANILLTDDGQPMLLDFNLSSDAKSHASAMAASIGGTLPYMSPEHLDAFRGNSRDLDARSDLYSMGIILFEMLTGTHPFPARGDLTPSLLEQMVADRQKPLANMRAKNPAVSPAVESIIRHCLEADPGKRYQSARELYEDLERHLHHVPLKYAPEPSIRERAQKWVRRHPRLASLTSVGVLAAAAIGAVTAGFIVRGEVVARHQAKEDLARFQSNLRTAQFYLCPRNIGHEELSQGLDACRSALDQYRIVENPHWDESPAVRRLDHEDQEMLRAEVGELLLLLAHGTAKEAAYQPEPDKRKEQFESALAFNNMAEARTSGGIATGALYMQRADFSESLGRHVDAKIFRDSAKSFPSRTVRDLYLTAREFETQGRFREALPLLEEATRRDPQNFAAWFVQGDCHEALSHDAEAAACFSACIALRPTFHGSWYNRGLVFLKQRFFGRAAADFDQAIVLRPDLPDAYINRALAKEGVENYRGAVEDLNEALERGTPRTRVYFMRAFAKQKAGDARAAQLDTQEGLRLEPADEKSWIARGLARLDAEPKAALADFDKALELNPRSIDALENKAHVLSERLNRTEEAVQVLTNAVELNPDFVPARAGRGVLLARQGKRDAALEDGRESLLRDTKAPNLYQVAGIYALCSKGNLQNHLKALELLSSALRSGFGWDLIDQDTDLDHVRNDPEFRRIVAAAKALQSPPGSRP